MRKVLLRASYPFALCFFLSVTALAAAPSFLFPLPTITAPAGVSVNTDKYSDVATQVSLGVPGVTGDVASIQNNAPAAFPIGVTHVLWTVTDQAGNTASATQAVTVADKEKPYLSRAYSISVVNDPAKCGAGVRLSKPYADDNSGSVTVTNNAPAFFPVGSFKVIWTATDPSGNWDTTTQMIKVIDNELPVISAPENIQVSSDAGSCGAIVDLVKPLVSDNCGIASLTNNAPASFPVGTTVVTWTVTDLAGYTATASQSITVSDQEKPLIKAPGFVSVVNDAGKCGALVNPGKASVSDNCGIAGVTNDAPAFFPVGTTKITWTVTDIHGNSDTATQLVKVIDNELPTISIANVTLNSEPGKCGATVALGIPETADNCGVTGVSNDGLTFYQVGTTQVTWTVTDKAGYTNSTIQTVTVVDNELPTITAPANIITFTEPGKCGASVSLGTPTAADNCGIAGVANNAPLFFPSGTTLVTWTVTDNSGNTATASQTVVVKDTERPVLSGVPANITVSCSNIPVAAKPTAIDNCDAAPVVALEQSSTQGSSVSASSYYNYTITRTWTATDANGNSVKAVQLITVSDNTAPVITAPANIVAGNDANACGRMVTFAASAADICGSPVTLTYSKASGTVFSSGTTNVTITAKDVSGNTSSKIFTVTINDIQKPTVTAPANKTATVSNSGNTATVSLGTPVTADNCGVKTITNNAPSSYPVGTTTVTWTVKDNAGNTATAAQTVTVSMRKRSDGSSESNAVALRETTMQSSRLEVAVAPNPSTSYFTLKLYGSSDAPVQFRVTDASGRVIESRASVSANSTIQVGHMYHYGTYFAEIMQGEQRKVIQLIKLK